MIPVTDPADMTVPLGAGVSVGLGPHPVWVTSENPVETVAWVLKALRVRNGRGRLSLVSDEDAELARVDTSVRTFSPYAHAAGMVRARSVALGSRGFDDHAHGRRVALARISDLGFSGSCPPYLFPVTVVVCYPPVSDESREALREVADGGVRTGVYLAILGAPEMSGVSTFALPCQQTGL